MDYEGSLLQIDQNKKEILIKYRPYQYDKSTKFFFSSSEAKHKFFNETLHVLIFFYINQQGIAVITHIRDLPIRVRKKELDVEGQVIDKFPINKLHEKFQHYFSKQYFSILDTTLDEPTPDPR